MQMFQDLAHGRLPLHFSYQTRTGTRHSSASVNVTEKLPGGQVRFLMQGESPLPNGVAPNIGRLDPSNPHEVIQESKPITQDDYLLDGARITRMTLGESGVQVWSLTKPGERLTTVVLKAHDGKLYGLVAPEREVNLSAFNPRRPVALPPKSQSPVVSTPAELTYSAEGSMRKYVFDVHGHLSEVSETERGRQLETVQLFDWKPAPVPGIGKYPSRIQREVVQPGTNRLTYVEGIQVRKLDASTWETLVRVFEQNSISWQEGTNVPSMIFQLMAR